MKRQLFIGGMLLLVFACYSICFRNDPNEYLKDLAPEIQLKSPSGKTVSLSKLKGKLVLIDFWASWCGPCRQESPNVVEAYNKYRKRKFTNGNGFEVFSVSLDKDENAWKNAIKADKFNWKNHGIDKGGVAAGTYGVASIPSGFLIDGEGNILAQGEKLRGLNLHITIDKYLSKN
jgi:thiol-disulfide isomerase/thioredoxin